MEAMLKDAACCSFGGLSLLSVGKLIFKISLNHLNSWVRTKSSAVNEQSVKQQLFQWVCIIFIK